VRDLPPVESEVSSSALSRTSRKILPGEKEQNHEAYNGTSFHRQKEDRANSRASFFSASKNLDEIPENSELSR